MKLVDESRTPGIRTLPAGSLMSFQIFHSCSWRGLDASNENPGAGLQHDIDNVFEGHITMMRSLVVPPAQM